MSRSFDDDTALFFLPENGKLFTKYGTVVFPSRQISFDITNKHTRVSIILEKRRAENLIVIKAGIPFLSSEADNYIFAYLFKGMDEKSGSRCIFSFFDEAKSRMSDDYEREERGYNNLLCKVQKLPNHQFIYYGSRNEG